MIFAGINYLAVLVAGVAGFAVGSVWYMVLGNAWMNALGRTKDDLQPSAVAFVTAIAMQLLMAFVLAGTMGHLGDEQITVRGGLITAGFCWLGFVLTTMMVNHRFQDQKAMLTVIDAGHWLAVLLTMGAIIGAFGV